MKIYRGFALLMVLLFSCSNQNQAQNLQEFASKDLIPIKSATYELVVAGVRGGGSNYNIRIELEDETKDYEFQKIYFKKQSSMLYRNKENPRLFTTVLKGDVNWEKIEAELMDPNIQKDSSKVDSTEDNFEETQYPFDLGEEEAVIEFINKDNKGNKRYLKLQLTRDESNVGVPM